METRVGDRAVSVAPASLLNGLTLGLVLLGVGVRVAFASSALWDVDADEAVVGLMARHLLDGDASLFFWGQQYGGAHESWLVAALLWMRVPAVLAMRLAPLSLFVVSAVLVWRIARRVVSDATARLAGAAFWAYPIGIVWMSMKERGFYGATLALSLTCLLFALRTAESWERRDALIVGLAAGAAWYASPQSLYLLAPTAAWLVGVAVREKSAEGRRGIRRAAPAMLAGLVVGAAPWLIANIASGWESLHVLPQPPTTFGHRLKLFATDGLPVLSGLAQPFNRIWFGGTAGQVLWVVAVAAGVVVFARLWWSRRPRMLAPMLLATLGYGLLFAAFPTSWFVNDPRYFTMFPAGAVIVVAWMSEFARPAVVVAGVVSLAAIAVVGTVDVLDFAVTAGRAEARWDVTAGDLDPLVDLLDEEGVERVFADYWIAHRLDFETDERIIAAPLQDIRHVPYEAAVRDDPTPAYVTFARSGALSAVEAHLRDRQIAYRVRVIGEYAVYFPAARVLPEDVSHDWYTIRLSKAPGLLESG